MKRQLCLIVVVLALFSGCSDDEPQGPVGDNCGPTYEICLEFGPGEEAAIEEALLLMEDSTKIKLLPGNYSFENLSVVGVETAMFTGSGPAVTTLDFSMQTSGGEGIRLTNTANFIIRDMTITDSRGDLLKITNSDQVTISNIHAIWNSEADSSNGGYGIYPVLCTNVLIDSCYVQGASDAGIYVGQTNGAIVRNSEAFKNVAGYEIENTTQADVYDNEFHMNTGGLLIFDLPNLSQRGGQVRAWNNYIHDNNFPNFAPSSSFGTSTGVGNTPPGSGILHVAMSDVEIFDNIIENNNLSSIDIVSGFILDENAGDYIGPAYYPFPRNVYIHGNQMSKQAEFPAAAYEHELGSLLINLHELLNLLDPTNHPEMQHILIDGLNSNALTGDTLVNPDNLCIQENEANLFLNLDLLNAGQPGWQVSTDVSPFTVCP